MRSTLRFWTMLPTCARRHRPPRRNSACPIRGMCGRKYSFCSKIFKKIYRIAAIYAIIGLTSWPRRSFCSVSTSSYDRRGQELAIARAAVRQAAAAPCAGCPTQPAKRRCGGGIPEPLRACWPAATRCRSKDGAPCAVEALQPGEAVTLRGAEPPPNAAWKRYTLWNKNRGVIPDEAAKIL